MKRIASALREETFDVLILGGGITGAGVALDAVLRGLRVALVDKGDFASGTSGVSSKLVHGGLRYLEHGDFRLVYEALHERRRLLVNAPHLVRPLRFLIPFYEAARVRPWKWRAGLWLYDLLAGRSNLRRSRKLDVATVRDQVPFLQPKGLQGSAAYFDAQMDDARLCLEVAATAAREGACVGNYVEVIAFETHAGAVNGVRALDRIGGDEFAIRARQILNATGPWLDRICALAGDGTAPRLRPTKGVHLIAPGQELTAGLLLLHPADGRVFFVLPWMNRTLVGTTDTLWEGPPEQAGVTEADIDYLLAGYNHYFTRPLDRRDLVGSFVGLRPLIRTRSGEPSSLSREFQLFESASGLLSAAGGKFTTYRRMAETITDRILERLGRREPCRTRHYPLDGAPPGDWQAYRVNEAARLQADHGLSPEGAEHLVNRYGRRANDVAAYLGAAPALVNPILDGEPDLNVELVYQREQEMAVTRADHFLRRTRLGLFHPELLESR